MFKIFFSCSVLLFCLVPFTTNAQVNGKITNLAEGAEISLRYHPLGYPIMNLEEAFIQTDKEGNFSISLPLKASCIAYFGIKLKDGTYAGTSIFISPDTDLGIMADAENFLTSLRLDGNLKAENEYFQQNKIDEMEGLKGKFKQEKQANACWDLINTSKKEALAGLEQATTQQKFKAEFVQYMKAHIEYTHLKAFNDLATAYFSQSRQGSNTIFTDNNWDTKWKEEVLPVFQSTEKGDFRIRGCVDIFSIMDNTSAWVFFLDLQPLPEEMTQEAYEAGTFSKRIVKAISEYIPNEENAMFAEGYFIYRMAMQTRYEKYLIDMAADFDKKYPEHPFKDVFLKFINPIKTFHEQKESALDPAIKIIKDYPDINTFADLIAPFKGKVVLIDLWGTWCGPCKHEFEFLEPLKARFKDAPLEYLYVAYEQHNSEEKWENMLKFYNLKGHHLIGNELLFKEIWAEVSKINKDEMAAYPEETQKLLVETANGMMMFPTYLIINKNGEVSVRYAHKPSSQEKLYTQIEQVLSE